MCGHWESWEVSKSRKRDGQIGNAVGVAGTTRYSAWAGRTALQHSPQETSVLSSVTWVQGGRPSPGLPGISPRGVWGLRWGQACSHTLSTLRHIFASCFPCQGQFQSQLQKNKQALKTKEDGPPLRRKQEAASPALSPVLGLRDSGMESVALYSFQATESDELAFSKGDTLKVGWPGWAEWAPLRVGALRTRDPGEPPEQSPVSGGQAQLLQSSAMLFRTSHSPF